MSASVCGSPAEIAESDGGVVEQCILVGIFMCKDQVPFKTPQVSNL